MKIFLDDFTIYSDMETHLQKLELCFQKCKVYNISLNLEKCVFMVFKKVIIGFIVFKIGKLPNPKKIYAIMNMHSPHNSLQIQIFNDMAQFYRCFINNFAMIVAPTTKLPRKTKSFLWIKEFLKAWELIK
jgi:hypothetical protein